MLLLLLVSRSGCELGEGGGQEVINLGGVLVYASVERSPATL